MRFKGNGTEQIRITGTKRRTIYYENMLKNAVVNEQTIRTGDFSGDGGSIDEITVLVPDMSDTTGLKLRVVLHDNSTAGTLKSVAKDLPPTTNNTFINVDFGYIVDDGGSYYISCAIVDSSDTTSQDWPETADSYVVGGIYDKATCRLYCEGDFVNGSEKNADKYVENFPLFFFGNQYGLSAGNYEVIITFPNGKYEIQTFTVGVLDLIDAAITSRAPASVADDIAAISDDINDAVTGLSAIKDGVDSNGATADMINDSVGVPGSGEGTLHAKIGAYNGNTGDNNNIKDDIANLAIAGANARQIWEYAPDGTEGADSTADKLTRATAAAEHNKDEIDDGTHGLSALKSTGDDITGRIGDPTPESLTSLIQSIISDMDDPAEGLAAIKAAIDTVDAAIGTPNDSSDTVLNGTHGISDDINDPVTGLSAIKDGVDSNGAGISDALGRIGSDADDGATGTLWGDVNDIRTVQDSILSKLDGIIARLDDGTHGLSVIKAAVDSVLSNQGDTATHGTLTEQSQAITAMLSDASTGLSAIKGAIDTVDAVIGTPAGSSIADDIGANWTAINDVSAKVDAVQSDINDLIGRIGDPGATDISARLTAISSDIAAIIESVGTLPAGEGTLHAKAGDYDGIRTEVSGILISGHRIIDDLKILYETMLTAQFPGSGAYLNTDGGYYANNQFYDVGTGPVVDDFGVPVGGARVTAFMDSDGDEIFERMVARAYTDGAGKWQMALDSGVYLLSFYKPGFLLKYEWRVVDPNGSGLEPPDHAPTGGDLPNGGDGLI